MTTALTVLIWTVVVVIGLPFALALLGLIVSAGIALLMD